MASISMLDLHFDVENNNNKNQQKLKPKSVANYARLSSARINNFICHFSFLCGAEEHPLYNSVNKQRGNFGFLFSRRFILIRIWLEDST